MDGATNNGSVINNSPQHSTSAGSISKFSIMNLIDSNENCANDAAEQIHSIAPHSLANEEAKSETDVLPPSQQPSDQTVNNTANNNSNNEQHSPQPPEQRQQQQQQKHQRQQQYDLSQLNEEEYKMLKRFMFEKDYNTRRRANPEFAQQQQQQQQQGKNKEAVVPPKKRGPENIYQYFRLPTLDGFVNPETNNNNNNGNVATTANGTVANGSTHSHSNNNNNNEEANKRRRLSPYAKVTVLDGENDELFFTSVPDSAIALPGDVEVDSETEDAGVPLFEFSTYMGVMEKKRVLGTTRSSHYPGSYSSSSTPASSSSSSATPSTPTTPGRAKTKKSASESSLVRKWKDGTYINADLRYFNLECLGKFDVILIDPPWRISGAQRHNQSSNMFSNNRFNLEYNTLSNAEVMDIDVGVLSDHGFIFLWVVNSALPFGIECMNKWGFTYVDRLTWIKKTSKSNIGISHGYYFLHSSETCLIGVKYKKGAKLQYISKVTNDIIFAEMRQKSRKPDELYEIIEAMMPGARKIELFAKNHNIRAGWLSIGNRLGPNYDTDWMYAFTCDDCSKPIKTGNTRYKSRTEPNKDLCSECFDKILKAAVNDSKEAAEGGRSGETSKSTNKTSGKNKKKSRQANDNKDANNGAKGEQMADYDDIDEFVDIEGDEGEVVKEEGQEDEAVQQQQQQTKEGKVDKYSTVRDAVRRGYFELENNLEEIPFHDWFACDICGMYPICGVRFSCTDCKTDFDTCESCFDSRILEPPEGEKDHPATHHFEAIELPSAGDGFQVHHRIRCDACLVCPIIGERFKCDECTVELCRKCFFMKKEPKNHSHQHEISLITEPILPESRELKCIFCKTKPIIGAYYKCNSCLNFDLCETCYNKRHSIFPSELLPSHKTFHKFTKINN